ncbi:hypothetical protein STANM309S_00414 [Streptomyces tanashiensis]
MWTGGFPEPLTFSLRARRMLAARRGDFDVVHDNQTLGYGLLGGPRAIGAPLVTTIHHPITVDRQLELDAAADWKRRASVRRWYAFTGMQKKVARRLPSVLTVSGTSRQEIVDHLGVREDRIKVVHIGADTDLWSPDPSVAEIPWPDRHHVQRRRPPRRGPHPPDRGARQAPHREPRRPPRRRRQAAEDGPVAAAIERCKSRYGWTGTTRSSAARSRGPGREGPDRGRLGPLRRPRSRRALRGPQSVSTGGESCELALALWAMGSPTGP